MFESILRTYILDYFNLQLSTEGEILKPASEGGETFFYLLTNFFHIVKILIWMGLVVTTIRFLNFLIFRGAFRNSQQNEISSLLWSVFSIIIYIVAFFIIFKSQYPKVDLAALFTTSTILGIVIGLALQDTLGNLFAGIAMQADQPFQVGDVINISNRGMGVVEAVSWRGVRIRTFQNKLLLISNSVLGKETIEVSPKDNLNADIVLFSTLYSHSPAKTIQVVREAVRQVENVSPKIRPNIRIRNLGDSGIEWEAKYWLEDYSKIHDTNALIRQRIWYALQREHIEFSYPTRTIHVETKPQDSVFVETNNTIFERLSAIPIFAPLSDDETLKLAKGTTARVYAPGETIVKKGQEGHSMFVIHRGAVKVQLMEHGQPKTINNLRENDFFGEMSLLTGQPRSANVVAEEETEVFQIKKKALKPIFETNPDLVTSICEIIDQRRKLLMTEKTEANIIETEKAKSVFGSIRKFFGLDA
ncbi:MAG TPA: mechanosensitive ion channel family protein [Pyrinomonadaceae bacterium]|nr:mechanosensitive ion channel family protein [Pyrinomonadaceae bacterium]